MDVDLQHREGGDIFAEDMQQPELVSRIAESFGNSTVFLTGGTGFIGKCFLEKLLRTCKNVKVFVLVRPKKNKGTSARFQEIFEGPNMVPLRLANPNFPQQVRLMSGDCLEENMGLTEEDRQILISEVNYIIHCAATVRFDEDLKTAAHINVRSLKDLITMAKSMKNLWGFLHVSTAYAHCPRNIIDEEFYEAGMEAEDLLQLVKMMDKEKLENITPGLIKEWPNTYVFTKAIGENLVKSHASKLPIAVLRPSIVISSMAEPLAGWIDNLYGVTGLLLAGGLGLIRVFPVSENKKADVIPADYVTNAGLAVLWEVAKKRSLNENLEINEGETEPAIIYNAVSSAESPLTWGEFIRMTRKEAMKNPSIMQLWYPVFFYITNLKLCAILAVFMHTIPAYLIDCICFCLGKEQRLIKGYQKINKYSNTISYFTLREWKFGNKNLQALWQRLESEDQRLFPFSMRNFHWKNFTYFYIRGIRVYLLKDPLETIPKAKKKMRILIFSHYILLTVLTILLLTLLNFFFKLYS